MNYRDENFWKMVEKTAEREYQLDEECNKTIYRRLLNVLEITRCANFHTLAFLKIWWA